MAKRKAARDRTPRDFYLAVAGVTFEGRQRLIRKHCREGDAVELRAEPDNPHSKTAVGVWVRKRAWLFGGRVKVGFVPHEDSGEISRLLRRGWTAEASIEKVFEGGWFKSYGLRIAIRITPPDQDL